ncbi:MAG: AAA family ATPase [Clostridia bacterium]|nr:AAA family ATPase [Clostridia bacterium]
MGEYMKKLLAVERFLYAGRTEAAKEELRDLLNCLNEDFKKARMPMEKERTRQAIVKLLPALEDLKKGQVSARVVSILRLDPTQLPSAKTSLGAQTATTYPTDEMKPDSSWLDDVSLEGIFDLPTDKLTEPAKEPAPAPEKKEEPRKPKKAKNGAKKEMSPLLLEDYIGQEKAKASLRISIAAAKKENRALSHLLICSSYGLGKTTLANIIANEMEMPFFTVNATNLKDTKSLSLFFSKIEESCIIFIDEIHSLKNDVQTVLLSILTDFAVSFIDENGEEQYYDLPPFTLIGATTQAGELLKPFLNRFTILELVDYTPEEKDIIVKSKFAKLGYEITPEAVADVAKRSRGVPRTIETYAKGIRDIALTQDSRVVTTAHTQQYFTMYDIDELGLTKNDLLVLEVLAEATKPLALITLESKTGIQKEDLAYRYEPYLLKLGLMDKTASGRVITQKGREYLSPDAPKKDTEESPEDGADDSDE